jgi:hypothetical protein
MNSCGTLSLRPGFSTIPGATALARIPSRPQRDATCRVSALIPAFAAAYDGRSGSPMCAVIELVNTIAPPPRASIGSIAWRAQRKYPRRFTCMVRSNTSSGIVFTSESRPRVSGDKSAALACR